MGTVSEPDSNDATTNATEAATALKDSLKDGLANEPEEDRELAAPSLVEVVVTASEYGVDAPALLDLEGLNRPSRSGEFDTEDLTVASEAAMEPWSRVGSPPQHQLARRRLLFDGGAISVQFDINTPNEKVKDLVVQEVKTMKDEVRAVALCGGAVRWGCGVGLCGRAVRWRCAVVL